MSTRRKFLKQSTALAAALATTRLAWPQQAAPPVRVGRAKRSLKVLFIGGTDFLGPPAVRRAMERGHVVTLFNRGRTNPQLFPELEKIRGDRNVERDLQQLAGREFDAVVDTCGYFPRQVRESAGVLAATTSHYVFISSIAVYRPRDVLDVAEYAPLDALPPMVDADTLKPAATGTYMGPLKVLCEQAAEAEMPGQVASLRCGMLLGPGSGGAWSHYFPVRVSEGGEVLAPGTPKDPVQFIDALDVGSFIVQCLESSNVGAFNVTGPRGGMPIEEFLQTCKTASKSDARFTYVPDEFLREQKIRGWIDLPPWTSPRETGMLPVSVAKAVAAGLAFRPAIASVGDTLEWCRSTEGKRSTVMGLSRDAEAKALAAWHAITGRRPAPSR